MFSIDNNILDFLTLIYFTLNTNINLICYIFIISVISVIPIILFSKRILDKVINGVIYGGAARSAYSGFSQAIIDYTKSKFSSNNNNNGDSSNNNNNDSTKTNNAKTESNKKSIFLFNKKNQKLDKYLYSANLIPFLNFDWTIAPENMSSLQQIFWGLLGLNIVLLWCLIDVLGYFITLYAIKYVDLENKYKNYIKIINYFKKFTYLNIIIELVFIFVTLLTIIGLCIIIVYQ
uniref:hypothetical protein n=1 Tax=Hericium alpestre TaxID=135208 RepID=UPI002435D3A7|nr:hypothetical protein QEO35_mgp13 [Hericium alpestre]WEX32020.1 hypothetical protein [Hericium alpestre]